MFNHHFSYYYQGIIVPATIVFPIVAILLCLPIRESYVKRILYYLLTTGIINLVAIIWSGNNLPLLHIYTITEFVLLVLYFISINTNTTVIIVSRILLFVFPVLAVLNALFLQSRFHYNSYIRSLESIIMIMYAIYYFLGTPEHYYNQIKIRSLDWINAGILAYFSFSFFIFLLANVIGANFNHQNKMVIWNLHDTFVILMYLFIGIGILKCKQALTIPLS